MAFVSFLAALVIFLLPETLNAVQPTTIDDLRLLLRTRRLISRKGLRKPGKADTEKKEDSSDSVSSTAKQENNESATYQNKSVQTDEIEGGVDNEGFDDYPL